MHAFSTEITWNIFYTLKYKKILNSNTPKKHKVNIIFFMLKSNEIFLYTSFTNNLSIFFFVI